MKIEDEILLTKETTCHPGRIDEISLLSVRDRNVKDLINLLEKERIEISQENSEQKIEYRINGEVRNPSVPLLSSFDVPVKVVGYNLRDKEGKLEIELMDYKRVERGYDRGCAAYLIQGVRCLIRFSGTYKEGRRVETIKEILRKFYESGESYGLAVDLSEIQKAVSKKKQKVSI